MKNKYDRTEALQDVVGGVILAAGLALFWIGSAYAKGGAL